MGLPASPRLNCLSSARRLRFESYMNASLKWHSQIFRGEGRKSLESPGTFPPGIPGLPKHLSNNLVLVVCFMDEDM